MLKKFMKITSNSEQAENTKNAERQQKVFFRKNRLKIQTCINPY